jgi:hypothetical protein
MLTDLCVLNDSYVLSGIPCVYLIMGINDVSIMLLYQYLGIIYIVKTFLNNHLSKAASLNPALVIVILVLFEQHPNIVHINQYNIHFWGVPRVVLVDRLTIMDLIVWFATVEKLTMHYCSDTFCAIAFPQLLCKTIVLNVVSNYDKNT